MHRRTVGVILLCISAFLYGVRYLSAAIFGSGVSSWNSQLFNAMLEYVGDGPLIMSWIALIAGIGYLIFAEFETFIVKNIKEIKDNWNDFDSQNGRHRHHLAPYSWGIRSLRSLTENVNYINHSGRGCRQDRWPH